MKIIIHFENSESSVTIENVIKRQVDSKDYKVWCANDVFYKYETSTIKYVEVK